MTNSDPNYDRSWETWEGWWNPQTGGGYESDEVMADRLACTRMALEELDLERNQEADGA